jgi:hypothetical protein
MLASKGTPSFRSQFTEFLIEEFKDEIDITKGKKSLHEDVILQFIMTFYVGIVEWWFKNGMPYPPQVLAEQVGVLLGRNL